MFKKKKHRTSDGFEVLTANSPFAYSEAFKSLRTNLEFVSSTDNCKTIMMVSALSGEGKTTVSINLAIALAQDGKKVLLCDCDLRKPKVQRYLRIKHSSEYGVSTVLSGSSEIDSAIGFVEELGIYVMLSGPTPPNPSELLASESSKRMFEELKTRFDFIICDTPPVAIVADSVAFSKYMDGAIMIVRQNYSTRSQITEGLEKLGNVGTNMLGVVLNNYDSKVDNNYKYDKYYNYRSYYAYGYEK